MSDYATMLRSDFFMVKQEAMECLQTLPDTVDWDDIQYALYVM